MGCAVKNTNYRHGGKDRGGWLLDRGFPDIHSLVVQLVHTCFREEGGTALERDKLG